MIKDLLPGWEGIHVLVLRHVHVEPPGAGHDVALDGTLQGGGDVLGSLLQLRPPRDPEIFLCQSVEGQGKVCRLGQARQGFKIPKPIH